MQKNRKLPIILIAFFVISIGFWSCQWHTIEPVIVEVPTDTISFSGDIQAIFDVKCNSCHNNQSPKLTEGNSYNNLINGDFINTDDPESSIIITKITDGHFATYSQEEQTLLLTWIQQGALDN